MPGNTIELLETPKALCTNLHGKSCRGSAQEVVITEGMIQWAISSEASKGRSQAADEERSETKW